MNKKGQLIVVSGPSGVGKGTVIKEYLASRDQIAYSVSATTRSPRPGEEHGVHYFFLSREEFEQTVQSGGMLEYASYNNNYYGTPKKPVEEQRAKGNDVVLEIEVQGALQVKKACPDALLIFIAPPSFEELAKPSDRPSDRGQQDGGKPLKHCTQGTSVCKRIRLYYC